jgi:hypothetical protein
MRIKNDGLVYRIELNSVAGEFETRISHAVNVHGELTRPRLEIGRSELESFFVEALPHVLGHCLVMAVESQSLEAQQKIIAGLIRLAEQMAAYCTADQERRERIPKELRVKLEILNALRNPPGADYQVDQTILREAVDVLLKRLEELKSVE